MKKILLAMAVAAAGVCSCSESAVEQRSLGLNDSLVMPYVECSPSAVARCFAIGDSVYARMGKYTLEDLGYFCVDNLPSKLIMTFATLIEKETIMGVLAKTTGPFVVPLGRGNFVLPDASEVADCAAIEANLSETFIASSALKRKPFNAVVK